MAQPYTMQNTAQKTLQDCTSSPLEITSKSNLKRSSLPDPEISPLKLYILGPKEGAGKLSLFTLFLSLLFHLFILMIK